MTIKELKKQLEELRIPDDAEICARDSALGNYMVRHLFLAPTLKEDDLGQPLGKDGTIILS